MELVYVDREHGDLGMTRERYLQAWDVLIRGVHRDYAYFVSRMNLAFNGKIKVVFADKGEYAIFNPQDPRDPVQGIPYINTVLEQSGAAFEIETSLGEQPPSLVSTSSKEIPEKTIRPLSALEYEAIEALYELRKEGRTPSHFADIITAEFLPKQKRLIAMRPWKYEVYLETTPENIVSRIQEIYIAAGVHRTVTLVPRKQQERMGFEFIPMSIFPLQNKKDSTEAASA